MTRNRKRNTLLMPGALILGLGCGSTLAPANWLVAPAQAQEAQKPAESPNDQLIRTLFGRETTPDTFTSAVQQAKAAGIPAQVILEAQIVRTFYTQDTGGLLALLEPLQKTGPTLDLAASQLFDERSDYDSLVHGVMALQAGEKQDAAAFENHIKEAIWLSPMTLQPLYLTWLNDFRSAEAMRKIVVPLDTKIGTFDGKQTTLKDVLGGNKALLIDFWASWCAPCMNAMDELKAKGAALAPQGVVVAGLNTENDAAIATQVRQQKNISLPWLVEPAGEPYTGLLKVDSIPRMVLISPEGKVLYNGHPSDPALKTALAKVGATL